MYNLTVDEAHTFFVGDGAWLVHNCNYVKLGDNETLDLEEIAKQHRRISNYPQTEGNMAVMEYIDSYADDGTPILKTVVHRSDFVGKRHAEIVLLEQLQSRGINPERITRAYSELQPCVASGNNCRRVLQQALSPDATVYYRFDYETLFHTNPKYPNVYSSHLESEWMKFKQFTYESAHGLR